MGILFAVQPHVTIKRLACGWNKAISFNLKLINIYYFYV